MSETLYYLNVFTNLIAVGLVIYYWNHTHPIIKMLFVFSLSSFCFDCAGYAFYIFYNSTWPAGKTYHFWETFCQIYFYYLLFGRSSKTFKIIFFVGIASVLYPLISYIYIGGDSYWRPITKFDLIHYFVFIFFALLFYARILFRSDQSNIVKYAPFWIVTVIIMFFASGLLRSSLDQFLTETNQKHLSVSVIFQFFYLVRNLSFAFIVWKTQTKVLHL
jgi:hypothetical protein